MRRHFYRRFSISPKHPAPIDRLVDLGGESSFDTENIVSQKTWLELDAELAGIRHLRDDTALG